VTNDAGIVTLSVPSGYNGFLLSLWDASLPAQVYIDPPVFRSATFEPPEMITRSEVSTLAGLLGSTLDGSAVTLNPDQGILFLSVYDCGLNLAPGVVFSMSPAGTSAVFAYSSGGLYSTHATMSDTNGGAVVGNVPVGTVTITATIAATHRVIGAITAFSVAGTIGSLNFQPTLSAP